MYRIVAAGLALALALGSFAVSAQADAWWTQKDATANVPVTFNLAAGTSLSLVAKTVSSGAISESGVTFTYAPGQDWTVANEYVEMTVSSNYGSWTVATYTDNGCTSSDTTIGWGALIGTDTDNRIPLVWKASDDYNSSVVVIDDTRVANSEWIWYIDKGNYDYAKIAADTQTMYTTVLFGEPGELNLNFGFGSDVTSPVAFYVAAATKNVVPDQYSTKLYFDLLHL